MLKCRLRLPGTDQSLGFHRLSGTIAHDSNWACVTDEADVRSYERDALHDQRWESHCSTGYEASQLTIDAVVQWNAGSSERYAVGVLCECSSVVTAYISKHHLYVLTGLRKRSSMIPH